MEHQWSQYSTIPLFHYSNCERSELSSNMFKKNIMKNYNMIFIIIILICTWPMSLYADGTYYIAKDEDGVYFQTDKNSSWYIDPGDLRYFKIGQRGIYSIGKDKNGKYLITDKKRKFYIDISMKDQLSDE